MRPHTRFLALLLCTFAFAAEADAARSLPWNKRAFNWSTVTFPPGLTLDDVKKCHEKLATLQTQMMSALKADKADAFVACWPHDVEVERYLSARGKLDNINITKELIEEKKKERATVDDRHRTMFAKLRKFLIGKFGSIENVTLVDLTIDDMASGLSPENGGYMKVSLPMYFSTKDAQEQVVSIDIDGDYLSGELFLSLSGLTNGVWTFDKNAPDGKGRKILRYEDIK